MRTKRIGEFLTVRAIAGTHVVTLGWDFTRDVDPTQFTGQKNLLGFAVQRTSFDEHGGIRSRGWLRGIKRFADKDKGLPPGSPVPTSEHPVQSFQWGDYTVDPKTDYEYRVVPVFGQPKNLHLADELAQAVRVQTEATYSSENEESTRHDIHFNRGVIGSQAYAREFGNVEPDSNEPESKEMKWLSRGLHEALIAYIGQAKDEQYRLYAAFYEFHYPTVAAALARAAANGAQVRIVYDNASGYKVGNNAAIDAAGLRDHVIPRTVTEGIRHNKFMILFRGDVPLSVWTGSTNISPGGIFGHSNVGHVVHDQEIARQFYEYWSRLAQNHTPLRLRGPNAELSPLPDLPLTAGVTTIFSPREDKQTPQAARTLQWYADRAAEAKRIVCFTAAFDIAPEFQKVFRADGDSIRYIVKDDPLSATENLGVDGDVVFAAGGRLGDGALASFLAESENPLNRNDFIHTKYMLVDPLGDDPLVITGSANFSFSSQAINDENMLIIKGDQRVADIYFGEFMRLFDHHYARYLARKVKKKDGGFLKDDAQAWLPTHFKVDSYKLKRRKYFVE